MSLLSPDLYRGNTLAILSSLGNMPERKQLLKRIVRRGAIMCNNDKTLIAVFCLALLIR